MVGPNDLETLARPSGGLGEPSRPADAAGSFDTTGALPAPASPVPGARDLSAEETRISQGAAIRPRVRPPREELSASVALRSEDPLAETLAHDSTHERPLVDLGSDRVGRYAVLSKLGQGGMGAVYTAYDEELDRRVALKLVRDSVGLDTLGHARMQREAQAMARLSHPNVVQIYDVGSHAGQVFIAMEFVRGATLRAWQERRDPATVDGRRAILDVYIQAGRGLAAAHRAGMVHRDFKPDNVLVGDDGRARVLDFGLAASIGQAATALGVDADRASVATGLTLTGAVLGTPAFMAPELFLARASDARTDQFSFCVALYRALYGAAPFAGETFTALASSVCSGEIEAAPERAAVPLWLRAVLVRGLARSPDDRYPDMDALLAALASDPGEIRRRRLRALARFGLATLVSALLLYLGSVAWTLWRERQRERAAAERLDRMEARVAELVEEGDRGGADRVFDAFVRSPENQGTAALPIAWLHRARRAEEAGEHTAALAALAASFAVATAPEHEIEALQALLRSFRAGFQWQRVSEVVRVLEARAPEALADPELRDAQIVAATSRLDLAGAVAATERLPESPRRRRLARLFAAMTPAHRTENEPGGMLPEGTGEATELVYWTNVNGERLIRVGATLDLPVLGIHGGYKYWRAVPSGPREPARYSAYDASAGEIVLLQAQGDALIELTRVKDHPALAAASADLDGDGLRELFLGTGPYSRHLIELSPAADGSWSTRASAPSLDARSSDITSLFGADLDDDGVGELVVGLGPWDAYEVHVLGRQRASDEFTSRARASLGSVIVAPFRGPRGLEIAALSISTSSNARGEAVGLYLLRLAGDALARSSDTALPGPPDVTYGETLLAGDLDGDGIDEAVALQLISPNESAVCLVFSLGEEGEFDVFPLAGVEPLAIRDLDGDGDDELVVSTFDGVWVIGAGSERLPAPAEERVAVAPPPAGSDRWRDNWEHASELAQMGLQEQAADAFVALAESAAVSDEGIAARATLQAAKLRRLLREDGPAAALFARAAIDPSLTEEAGAAAIEALLSRGELGGLRALLGVLAAASAGALVDRARADLEARLAARLDLRFDRPLDPAWRIDAPLSLARDPLAATLDVEATGAASIAALPIAAGAGDLILEIDVDVRRIEWGNTLSISLTSSASEGRALAIDIAAGGGQSGQVYAVSCISGVRGLPTLFPIDLERPQPLGRRRVRAVLRPEPGILTCTIVDGDGVEISYKREPVAAELAHRVGRGELQIATRPIVDGSSLVSAGLHGVSVVGATIDERGAGDAQPLLGARRALVEGDHLGALAALDADAAVDVPEAERALWRLRALIHLGRWIEAKALLGAWLADPGRREAIEGGLGLLLRAEPGDVLALLRELEEPAALRRRLAHALGDAFMMRRRDREIVEQLRGALEDYRPTPGEEPGESASLLELRAEVYSVVGLPAQARRDFAEARAYRERSSSEEPARQRRDRATLMVKEATEAARTGDEAAARELLAEALRVPQQRARVEDMVAARPELVALGVGGG